MGNSAYSVSRLIFVTDQAPKYIRGHTITLAFVVMSWVLMAANV